MSVASGYLLLLRPPIPIPSPPSAPLTKYPSVPVRPREPLRLDISASSRVPRNLSWQARMAKCNISRIGRRGCDRGPFVRGILCRRNTR